jgi:hypothetical protein
LFVERLTIRERVRDIRDELNQMESMLFSLLNNENPQLYEELLQLKTMPQNQDFMDGRARTHVDTINSALEFAKSLKHSFKKYCREKQELQSFGQLMKGVNLDSIKHMSNP